jgi:hypothetical protein
MGHHMRSRFDTEVTIKKAEFDIYFLQLLEMRMLPSFQQVPCNRRQHATRPKCFGMFMPYVAESMARRKRNVENTYRS